MSNEKAVLEDFIASLVTFEYSVHVHELELYK